MIRTRALTLCLPARRNSGSHRRRDVRHRLQSGRPGSRGRSAAAGMGRKRRRLARAQPRPVQHARDDTVADQLPDRLQVEGEVALSLQGPGAFGVFSSTPISLNGTVYLQDLNSNVFALDRSTGKVKWEHAFNEPSVGPNGVAFGNGRLYGATETNAFALDPQTGKLLWTSQKLIRNNTEGIDMTPQLYDGTVLISTIPGNTKSFYKGNGDGIVWALDAATGKPKWTFNTVSDGAKLFGNPKVNSGGGLWYPPAVDSQGRVFISVANPAPLYGTTKFPNGSSRPGPDLYTGSLVALDGQTGKRLWSRQTVPHDVRDYDLQIPAILATVPVGGVQTEVALVAGKMGKVFAYRADDGRHLWTRSVGKHQHDTGPLPRKVTPSSPATWAGSRRPWRWPATVCSCRGSTLPRARGQPACRAVCGSHRPHQGPRRLHRTGRRNRQRALAAQAAVAGLRRGNCRQRRRVHQQLRRHGLRVRHTDRQDAVDDEGARRHQLLPGHRRRHAARRRKHERVSQEPEVRAHRLLAHLVTHQPNNEVTNNDNAHHPSVPRARGRRARHARPRCACRCAHRRRGERRLDDHPRHREGVQRRLSKGSLARPGTVTFAVKTPARWRTTSGSTARQTRLIQPGKTASLTVAFKKKAGYHYICAVPGHAAVGMKGVFTVR